jgi:hypothetical protein
MMGALGNLVPMGRRVMGMGGAMAAHIDPAVPGRLGRHRREGWRQLGSGLLLGRRRRRRRVENCLLHRRRRLVRDSLLRP